MLLTGAASRPPDANVNERQPQQMQSAPIFPGGFAGFVARSFTVIASEDPRRFRKDQIESATLAIV